MRFRSCGEIHEPCQARPVRTRPRIGLGTRINAPHLRLAGRSPFLIVGDFFVADQSPSGRPTDRSKGLRQSKSGREPADRRIENLELILGSLKNLLHRGCAQEPRPELPIIDIRSDLVNDLHGLGR